MEARRLAKRYDFFVGDDVKRDRATYGKLNDHVELRRASADARRCFVEEVRRALNFFEAVQALLKSAAQR